MLHELVRERGVRGARRVLRRRDGGMLQHQRLLLGELHRQQVRADLQGGRRGLRVGRRLLLDHLRCPCRTCDDR
jgi:hypothetical protein